jgi:hypothetical protein
VKSLSQNLRNYPGIWHGEELAPVEDSIASGFHELDALLPGGGWPQGALTEILVEQEGAGELSLLMPALARLSRTDRWIAWVAPPYLPYAPTLGRAGIELSRLLLIRAQVPRDNLWAAEQALRGGACAVVLLWPPAIDDRAQRRLQLAAEEGGSLAVAFSPAGRVIRPTFAALRLRVWPDQGRLRVHVLKRRGGGMPAPLSLAVAEIENADDEFCPPVWERRGDQTR